RRGARRKGPWMTPATKRCPRRVGDHPLESAALEAIMPAGEYGGGTVMVWDRGTYESKEPDVGKAWRAGRLDITLHGTKLKGAWVLVRTGGHAGKNWLMIKRHDDTAHERDIVVEEPRSRESTRLIAQSASDPAAA